MVGTRRVGAAMAVCGLLAICGCGGGAGEFKGGGAGGTPGASITPTTANVPGATPTLPPMSPTSIHFVGADQAEIGVRQSGLPEQSVQTFEVTDANGTPVPNVSVTFT